MNSTWHIGYIIYAFSILYILYLYMYSPIIQVLGAVGDIAAYSKLCP